MTELIIDENYAVAPEVRDPVDVSQAHGDLVLRVEVFAVTGDCTLTFEMSTDNFKTVQAGPLIDIDRPKTYYAYPPGTSIRSESNRTLMRCHVMWVPEGGEISYKATLEAV